MKIKLCFVLITLIIVTSCKQEEVKDYEFTKETFKEELTREGVESFWAMLMYGYSNAVSEEKSWGVIDPEYKKWMNTPDSIKGDPELVTRTLFGLGAWFSNPDAPSVIRYNGKDIDLADLYMKAIKNGTNPDSKGYWSDSYPWGKPGSNQFAVEAPAVALAYQLAKPHKSVEFSEAEKENLKNWLQIYSYGSRTNNWSLFYALTQTVGKVNGWKCDTALLHKNLKIGLSCYEGDGWFSDGRGKRHFDDYNNWVFATFLMYWYMIDGDSYPELKTQIPEMIRKLCDNQKYFYAPDGSHPEFGRSITYKFARLSSLILAYKLGFTDLSSGMLKRIIRKHIQYYVNSGAIDIETGIVRQTLTKTGSGNIREVYNYKGSTYWFMQTLASLWLLDDNDKFWKVEEELIQSEKTDFSKHFKIPGWLIVGDKNAGSVVLYNAGTDHAIGWKEPSYAAKYRKYAYHSGLGSLMGTNKYVPCDNMPVLVYNGKHHYPVIDTFNITKGEISVLKVTQSFREVIPKESLKLSTVILVKGEEMLRFMKINSSKNIDGKVLIGGYAHGFDIEKPISEAEKSFIQIKSGNFQTTYLNLMNETSDLQMDKSGYEGLSDKHSRYSNFMLPYQEYDLKKGNSINAVAIRASKIPVNISDIKGDISDLSINESGLNILWYGRRFQIDF